MHHVKLRMPDHLDPRGLAPYLAHQVRGTSTTWNRETDLIHGLDE